LLPVRPRVRSHSSNVVAGGRPSTRTVCLLTVKANPFSDAAEDASTGGLFITQRKTVETPPRKSKLGFH
jgi:hypothetical protein